jgi:hypothetical protein
MRYWTDFGPASLQANNCLKSLALPREAHESSQSKDLSKGLGQRGPIESQWILPTSPKPFEPKPAYRRSGSAHRHRFDIDPGVNDAQPSPRRPSNPQELAPGYLWNSTTQELIPILPEDHPDYRQNEEIIAAAIRRWNGGTSR